MNAAEREAILRQLDESEARLMRMGQSLTHDQIHYRPALDRWSVAENVEHIATTEALVLGNIQRILAAGPDASKRSVLDGKEEAFVADTAGRVFRFQAPEILRPTGKWQGEELWKQFETNRRRTRDFAKSTDADLRRHFHPHPVVGEMDCYQWLLLIASHCDRHRAQSEEVMATPGFPRAEKTSA
jgi:hypothetical protein